MDGRDQSVFTRVVAHGLPAAVVACSLMPAFAVAMAAEPACRGRSAAEEAVRACAASGEQILAGNAVVAAVYQEQFSRYSLRAGRCYVEMRVETIASDAQADRVGRFLYDGGTQELLAFAEIRNGRKSGRVFDLSHRTARFDNGGWDDASEYIYRTMAGDR